MISVFACLLFGITTTVTIPAPMTPTAGAPDMGLPALDSARIPVLEVPYDSGAEGLLVPATVNGHGVTLLLDYVTDSTVLSKAGLAKVGLSSQETVTITLGTSVLPGVPVDVAEPSDDTLLRKINADGILGAAVLTRYDLVVDGAVRKIRLYASSAPAGPVDSLATAHTGWLPPGIMPDDCTSMLYPQTRSSVRHPILFFFELNARPFLAMFHAGERDVKVYSAWGLALHGTIPDMEKIDGKTLGFCTQGYCAVGQVAGIPLLLGKRRVTIANIPVYVFNVDRSKPHGSHHQLLPPRDIDLGLSGVSDRIFVVSYSTRRVCMSYPRK